MSATVAFGGGGRSFKDDVIHSMKYTCKDKDELDKNIDFRWYEGYNHSLNLSVPDNSSDRIIRDVQKWLSGKI